MGHSRTGTPLFRISGTAGRIALKLGVWLGDHSVWPNPFLVMGWDVGKS